MRTPSSTRCATVRRRYGSTITCPMRSRRHASSAWSKRSVSTSGARTSARVGQTHEVLVERHRQARPPYARAVAGQPPRACVDLPPSSIGEYHAARLTGTTGSTFTGTRGRRPSPRRARAAARVPSMIRNVVEEHVQAAYEALKSHFPDFCGCDICRDDALVFTLNRTPPRYVSELAGIGVDRDQISKRPEPRARSTSA